MVEQLAVYFTYMIEQGGYWGAGFLMMLESMVAPVPSELVMPFVGFLVVEGKFSPVVAILVTSLGSIVGSLVSYYMGYYGGRPVVLKVGRYLLLNQRAFGMDRAMVRSTRLLDYLCQPIYTCCAAFNLDTRWTRTYADRALLRLHLNRSDYMEFFPDVVRVCAQTELDTGGKIHSRIGYSSAFLC